MATTKVVGKVLVGMKSIFFALTLLERLGENIEEGISNVEFMDSKLTISCDAFYEQIDSLIILLAYYLNEEADHELAEYLRLKYGIEFEGESAIDATGGEARVESASEELLQIPKIKFFEAFATVIHYGHPIVSNVSVNPVLSCDEMRSLFGRKALKPCIESLKQIILKKRARAYEQYRKEHQEIVVDVWR